MAAAVVAAGTTGGEATDTHRMAGLAITRGNAMGVAARTSSQATARDLNKVTPHPRTTRTTRMRRPVMVAGAGRATRMTVAEDVEALPGANLTIPIPTTPAHTEDMVVVVVVVAAVMEVDTEAAEVVMEEKVVEVDMEAKEVEADPEAAMVERKTGTAAEDKADTGDMEAVKEDMEDKAVTVVGLEAGAGAVTVEVLGAEATTVMTLEGAIMVLTGGEVAVVDGKSPRSLARTDCSSYYAKDDYVVTLSLL